MKKNLLIGILMMLMLVMVGCDNNNSIEENYDAKYKEMSDKLIEYGKLTYDMYIKNEEMIEPATYPLTLKDMEHVGRDISMFVNPKTRKECDKTKTKIEFIVKDPIEENKNNYSFNPIIVCD